VEEERGLSDFLQRGREINTSTCMQARNHNPIHAKRQINKNPTHTHTQAESNYTHHKDADTQKNV
jgi:hypothetical protein